MTLREIINSILDFNLLWLLIIPIGLLVISFVVMVAVEVAKVPVGIYKDYRVNGFKVLAKKIYGSVKIPFGLKLLFFISVACFLWYLSRLAFLSFQAGELLI